MSKDLVTGMQSLAADYQIPLVTDHEGGMFGFFFSEKEIHNNKEAGEVNFSHFQNFFNTCLSRGVYFAPSSYEAGFVSLAHNNEDINNTLDIVNQTFKSL